MATFDLILNIYLWYSRDIIGHEILAAVLLTSVAFVLFSSIGIPKPAAVAFLIPLTLGLIFMGFLGWFGWVIIMFAGLLFGWLVYRIFGG